MHTNQDFNITPKFSYWSEDQIYQLHFAALGILQDVGVLVKEEESLKLFKDGGAAVDGELVKIPNWMLKEALSTAPSKINVYNTDGTPALCLERNNIYFGLGTDLPYFTDPYTQEIRQTVLADVENVSKVTAKADNIDFISNLGLPSDVPQEMTDLYNMKAVRSYCKKPYLSTATGFENMKAIIDMAAIQAGGHEQLRLYPTLMQYAEPVTPLINPVDSLHKLLLCAEYGIPITYSSGIMAGGTGPVTTAGSMALGLAEGLAGLVLHQLKRKGSPFILGVVYSSMDMKTAVSCYGGPEFGMGNAIVGQLGRFYGLPTYGTCCCTDSNVLDIQAGMDYMFSAMMATLGGTNLNHDCAYLGSGMIGSLQSILMAGETIAWVRRFAGGVPLNKDTLALDLIAEKGHGGDYFTADHTAKNFRKEMWYPSYLNRKQHLAWQDEGSPSVMDKLSRKVHAIIEADTELVLTKEELAGFDKIIAERKAALGV